MAAFVSPTALPLTPSTLSAVSTFTTPLPPPSRQSLPHAVPPRARLHGNESSTLASHATPPPSRPTVLARIVLICGFETFNLSTYNAAAQAVAEKGLSVTVLTDTHLEAKDDTVLPALANADVVFCSLVFDYDQVEWLRAQLPPSALVFAFESALELMSETRVGTFSMASAADPNQQKGMPPFIKTVLRKLGLIGREEDKLAGYLALLKNAPKLLKLVPGTGARDLRHWLTVYSYWNAGGTDNVIAMLEYIAGQVLAVGGEVGRIPVKEVVQIPNVGLVHPARPGYFFAHPKEYIDWYVRRYPKRRHWSRVGVLLYRKHVVSNLAYIPQLIDFFEQAELIPLPVFITGVEAHIVVRDYLTSESKEKARKSGERVFGSYRRGKAASVDAVVSTIGYDIRLRLVFVYLTVTRCEIQSSLYCILTIVSLMSLHRLLPLKQVSTGWRSSRLNGWWPQCRCRANYSLPVERPVRCSRPSSDSRPAVLEKEWRCWIAIRSAIQFA